MTKGTTVEGATVFESKDGIRQGAGLEASSGFGARATFEGGSILTCVNYEGFEFAKLHGMLTVTLEQFSGHLIVL